MSAWSEAVWIVKQMEKQFQASGQIQKYQDKLNELKDLIYNLNIDLIEKNNQIQKYKILSTPLVSSSNNGIPSQPIENPQNGMIWFISSQD